MTKDEKFNKYKRLVHGAINHYFGNYKKINVLYKRFGLTYDDLAQIGYLAIWEALDKYDETKGTGFFYVCVHNKIRFFIKKHGSLVKMPYGNYDQVWSSYENKLSDDETFESLLAIEDGSYSEIENKIFFEQVTEILNSNEQDLLNKRLEGKSHGDIAKELQLSRQGVQAREQRMRDKIIKKMVG